MNRFIPFAFPRYALVCVFCISTSLGFCQYNDTIPNFKKFDHFVGVQVNPLIQQIFNFGGSDPVNNPYLIKYTMRNNETGFALNFGGGLNATSSETDDGLKTNSDSYDFRGGVGYQRHITKKLEAGIGLDLIYGNNNRETFSVQVFDFGVQTDSTITKVRNTSTRIGGGFQINLNYYLSERLLIGTESTLYYTRIKDQFNVEVDNYIIPNPQNPGGTESRSVTVINEEETGKSFAFLLPVAIYLSYKF